MRYAALDYPHAKAFADGLVNGHEFRKWVLRQIGFDEDARLLHEEMFAQRSSGTENMEWWNSHFTMSCGCPGCVGGKETDLLAIFESTTGRRLALHIEVKHPRARFTNQTQAPLYVVRAKCWVKKAPPTILPHNDAKTVLLFSERKRQEYAQHLRHFRPLITLEDVAKNFPNASAMNA